MHMVDRRGKKRQLVLVSTSFQSAGGRRMLRARSEHVSPYVSRAAATYFEMRESKTAGVSQDVAGGPPPAVFRDERGRVRMVYKEAVIRFRRKTPARKRKQILDHYGFQVRKRNAFIPDQWVVFVKQKRNAGVPVLDATNGWMEMDEVEFCSPNFVSEFRRVGARKKAKKKLPRIPMDQWTLENRGYYVGQVVDEDVDVRKAWKRTLGRPSIAVAVLDDGVDVEHPSLRRNIRRNPDPNEPRDRVGRDFYIPDDSSLDHFDPRPKVFQSPFDEMAGNDIHGTPCAGIIAADGRVRGLVGVAPRCKVLPVKVFHADYLASDARVADAIRYAAFNADVISCSWSSGFADDIELAIEDAVTLGRDGRGTACFFAAGNEKPEPVSFPANLPNAIAVAASTDEAKQASYSCQGPEVDIAAPSSGGVLDVTTTDVSYANRGFNLVGDVADDFGGTSAATPLAAGIAALMLSANRKLSAADVKRILESTTDKIGSASGYDANGHSPKFGSGRVNAGAAVDAV